MGVLKGGGGEQDMDRELERYHKNNALLELSIQDYKLKNKSAQSALDAEHEQAVAARLSIRQPPSLIACLTSWHVPVTTLLRPSMISTYPRFPAPRK
jgi:hypothetical protein